MSETTDPQLSSPVNLCAHTGRYLTCLRLLNTWGVNNLCTHLRDGEPDRLLLHNRGELGSSSLTIRIPQWMSLPSLRAPRGVASRPVPVQAQSVGSRARGAP